MLKPRIVIVEDESIVAMDLKQRLITMDYEVVGTVSNGVDAISLTVSAKPDMILMDIQIKGDMDGIETSRVILEQVDVPIIFLTANSDEATVERARQAGPFAYLLKPFEDRELKVGIDIALERHQLERDLKEQKEKWQTTLRSIRDAVITIDNNQIVTFLNVTAERFVKLNQSETIGKPLREVITLVNEDTSETRNISCNNLADLNDMIMKEGSTLLRRYDNTLLPVEQGFSIVKAPNGEVIGAVIIMRDVSKKHQLEQKAREYKEQLEMVIDNRTLELLNLNESLKREIAVRKKSEMERSALQEELERAKRMEAIGLLAGGVAHDLNNMLGPLVGYPDYIISKLPPGDPLIKRVELMSRAARNAANIIQDLLTLARRGRYELEQTDLNQILTEFLESLGYERLKQERPNISLKWDLQEDLPPLNGSGAHLSKVIMNLVVNAYDAINSTGTVTIKTFSEEIVKLRSGFDLIIPGEYIILSVKDTGCGISPKDIEKVFEPYFSNKRMEARSGSGLGLSVVYGIVKDHRGFYDILSKVDEGTEFLLYFPVSEARTLVIAEAEDIVGGSEKIVVVDDDEGQRTVLGDILTSFGYQVVVCESGKEALAFIKRESADLILIDMIMNNGLDGLDTYREIIKEKPEQKALIISGHAENERVDEALSLGAGAFIKKPITGKKITEIVRRELDRNKDTVIV